MSLVSVRGLEFGYGQGSSVLSDWNGDFFAGEIIAITGPSGRGKSTLLYILGLMIKPRSGVVLVDGRAASELKDAERARLRAFLFGFVFQDAALDPTRTVLDNVIESSMYRQESLSRSKVRALELMEQFGVALRASHKPGQVSGGQAQRIALCRALLNDPKIILADEPTGNLDAVSSAVVMEAFRGQANSGSTVIVATHDPNLVAQCDRRIEI
ncbi:ABC transporter ATP-binding protein [Glaciihabitans sp. INWT7]|uniref:ABC transporter ATP-binding protein n=1 Tax=Glaciihabitans sp. INWT7 TaxID=2596912 RepID=UPI00351C2617